MNLNQLIDEAAIARGVNPDRMSDEDRDRLVHEIMGPSEAVMINCPHLFVVLFEWAMAQPGPGPVRALQEALVESGAPVAVTGEYGPELDEALTFADEEWLVLLVKRRRVEFLFAWADESPEIPTLEDLRDRVIRVIMLQA